MQTKNNITTAVIIVKLSLLIWSFQQKIYHHCNYDKKKLITIAIITLKSIIIIINKTAKNVPTVSLLREKKYHQCNYCHSQKNLLLLLLWHYKIFTVIMTIVQNISPLQMLCKSKIYYHWYNHRKICIIIDIIITIRTWRPL